jgi:hypothetical protein
MDDLGLTGLLPLLLVAGAAWAGARWAATRRIRGAPWLASRWAPLVFGGLSAAALWWTWGSLRPVEVIHDETAYLFQAQLLATGRLVGPARPLPDFFEQFQLFSSPVTAAKYPPGFALALVPGIWLGLPGLMPVLLTGLSGGLLFALARRVATPAVALLAWAAWFVAPGSIPFRHLIMSETLTTTLWLAGWWSLWKWNETRRRSWLVAAAGLTAWCMIARPLTGLAYAVPIGLAALVVTARLRDWRSLSAAAGVALLVVSLLPIQNRLTTGNWRRSAWSEYAAQYAPTDQIGFGYDSTPPRRSLPPDFQVYAWYYGEFHRDFVPAHLPRYFLERTGQVLHDSWGRWVPAGAILAGLGLAVGGVPVLFAAATSLLLLLVHLVFSHPAEWSIYYQETLPVLSLLAALGTGRVATLIPWRNRSDCPRGIGPEASPAVLMVAGVVLLSAPLHLAEARRNYDILSTYHREFRQKLAAIPEPAIVFVRYSPRHRFHQSLVINPPDLGAARVWVVYDRGTDNGRLTAIAPGRTAYLYREQDERLVLLASADSLPPP